MFVKGFCATSTENDGDDDDGKGHGNEEIRNRRTWEGWTKDGRCTGNQTLRVNFGEAQVEVYDGDEAQGWRKAV